MSGDGFRPARLLNLFHHVQQQHFLFWRQLADTGRFIALFRIWFVIERPSERQSSVAKRLSRHARRCTMQSSVCQFRDNFGKQCIMEMYMDRFSSIRVTVSAKYERNASFIKIGFEPG
jgi:hypothetical protein